MSASQNLLVSQLSQNRKKISTPCYVYSLQSVQNNYRDLKVQLGTGLIYSLKANSCLDLLVRCGHVFDDGVEIASIGELNLLPKSESPRYINNPSADKAFIRAAIASKCTLVVDNISQLKLIAEFVGKRPISPLIIRLNPRVLDRFDDAAKTVRRDHFGFDWEDALQALSLCQLHGLAVAGFHAFRGSYGFEKFAFATAKSALQITREFENTLKYPLSLVNLGGGFDPSWRNRAFDFSQYRNLISEFPEHIKVVHESGRAIMGSAGYFVTEVRYVKSIDGQQYGICDGGMAQNFLLAKTESTFKKFQQPVILRNGEPVDSTEEGVSSLLVGTSCNKEDVIGVAKGVGVQPGDLAIFGDCGAYNATYTVAPFLNLPSSKSYLVE
ncbi:PLP-dependent decarboxylase [Microbulbifer sp. OS29]|uniref:PLP-dependent decarboxylase n=1 Tax=Microbulbifer okhotskensis TaxID=2926617 RepID=A0A9X2ES56_9GAMM|nr:PLP-dependent decarboxylase [Microbulbifer okhotskensis]MCO1334746.1 PLP-dependent decarboxylase [Microbulbifer okhotskensis]